MLMFRIGISSERLNSNTSGSTFAPLNQKLRYKDGYLALVLDENGNFPIIEGCQYNLEYLNEILDEISAEDKQLPSPVSEIIKSLEESIDSNEKERSIKYLNKLKNAFFDYYLSTDYKAQRKTKMYFMTTLLMIFYAMVISVEKFLLKCFTM